MRLILRTTCPRSPGRNWTAILGTATFFALALGMILALPIFITYGITLAWLRSRTGSTYPGMVVHGTSNAIAVILAVTLG